MILLVNVFKKNHVSLMNFCPFVPRQRELLGECYLLFDEDDDEVAENHLPVASTRSCLLSMHADKKRGHDSIVAGNCLLGIIMDRAPRIGCSLV